MSVENPTSENRKFITLTGFGLLLLSMGIFLCPPLPKLLAGLKVILTHPSLIDFDGFFWAGNLGSSFVNSGLLLLVVLTIYKITKTKIGGNQIAAALMMVGFAFYGKNLLNIWFPLIGVFLHGKINHKKASDVSALAFFSAALAPIFSVLAFGTEALTPYSLKAIIIGAVAGVFSGYLTGVFAAYFPTLHNGLILYNAGFAAGFAATLINATIKALGIGHDAYPYGESYISGQNKQMVILLFICFAYFIIVGIFTKGLPSFSAIFWHRSRGGNYVEKFGFGACLINMGAVGICVTLYAILIGGQLNGTVFACIFTAVGFATAGSTIRTQLPLMLGVSLGAFITGGFSSLMIGNNFILGGMTKVASRGMVLSAIFTCGMAPIVGEYGFFAGLLVGMTHSVLVSNIGPLHGWMSLYNNGFSMGIITTLFFPVYSKLGNKKYKTSKI